MKKLKRILLVDDDNATNVYNKYIIGELNCCEIIDSVENGEEALDYLQTKGDDGHYPQPELIFLDINMPIMNGWEFLEEYKELPDDQKASIIIVMLTTSINQSDMEKAKQIEHLSDFKSKPLDEDGVKGIIKQHFPEYF